jgi:hypothetical protein
MAKKITSPSPIASPSTQAKRFERLVEDLQNSHSEASKGYVARRLVQATLPHSKVDGASFQRTNGVFTLSINNTHKGLPYGTYPRLILAWLSTEVARTKSREVILGDSLTDFMRQIGLHISGGKRGTHERFREQLERLFTSTISIAYSSASEARFKQFTLADELDIWWTPKDPHLGSLFQSRIILSERFYQEIIENPISIDFRALHALRDSALSLDIYLWLSFRQHSIKPAGLYVGFRDLQMQFGSDYADDRRGRYSFRKKFLEYLEKALQLLPGITAAESADGILLYNSKSLTKQKLARKLKSSPPPLQTEPIDTIAADIDDPTIGKLKALGITTTESLDMIKDYGAERIKLNLQIVEHRLAAGISIRNRRAYTKRAIADNYASAQNDLFQGVLSPSAPIKREIIIAEDAVWEDVRKQFIHQYGHDIFISLLNEMVLVSRTEEKVVLGTALKFAAEQVESRYGSHIKTFFRKHVPDLKILEFIKISFPAQSQ